MNYSQTKNCPPKNTLNDFLQGKLEPPTLDECESHVEDCPQCHETLRDLKSSDTLQGYVAAAMNDSDTQGDRSPALNGLIERMLDPPAHGNIPNPIVPSRLRAEALADHAAEVLRCLEPATGSELGALGNYDLQRLIGAGSSGVVFQAVDRTLNRAVALKVLRPSLGAIARERFLAEAQSAASIEHANVVTIYQVGQEGRLAYMAMQWIPGQTLENQIAASGQIDEGLVRQIAVQVAAGLKAAHQKQIVHRDIKPANIWIVDEDQSVRILDFGLARIADDDASLTATGMLAGTPNFMSPEQTRGQELDGRSDLFSLGCLMYRLLTGRLPFGAPTVLATLQSIQNQQPLPVQNVRPEVSDDLANLTMALLEKQPVDRPESADQLIEMLEGERSAWPVRVSRYLPKEAGGVQSSAAVGGKASSSTGRGRGLERWITTAVALALLGWGGWMWGPQIVRIATDHGEIVIEMDDVDVQIEILKDGKPVSVVDGKSDPNVSVRSGNYELRAKPATVQGKPIVVEITPQELVINRGGKQVVKVTEKAEAKPALVKSDAGEENTKASEKSFRELLGQIRRIEDALGQVPFESKEGELAREELASLRNLIRDMKRQANLGNSNVDEDSNFLVYRGRSFDQWYRAANDIDPTTLADSIQACGELAETKQHRDQLFKIISRASRKHGAEVVGGTKHEHLVMSRMLGAIARQPSADVVDYIEREFRSGNAKSSQFCGWVMRGGFETQIANLIEIRKEVTQRGNTLLTLLDSKEEHRFAFQELVSIFQEHQESDISMLDPEIIETAERMFWSGGYAQQSHLAGLLAHWKIGDEKVVKKIEENFNSPPNEDQSVVPFYGVLTGFGYGDGGRNWLKSTSPTVGWHDELRVSIMLRMLERLAAGKQIQMRYLLTGGMGGGGFGDSRFETSPAQFTKEILFCLYEILPTLDQEDLAGAKDRLVKLEAKLIKQLYAKMKEYNSVTDASQDRVRSAISEIEQCFLTVFAICDGKTGMKPEPPVGGGMWYAGEAQKNSGGGFGGGGGGIF
jgi:serine/threonine protein kinase